MCWGRATPVARLWRPPTKIAPLEWRAPSRSMTQDLAEEELGALVARIGEERLRLVLLDDLAHVHEDHAVGNRAGEAHLVGDAEPGPALAPQLDHDVEHLLDPPGVERRGRLVEQHDLWPHAKLPGG